ncbi:hypothetical protein C0991_007118, partial [Blastosporella zonata]
NQGKKKSPSKKKREKEKSRARKAHSRAELKAQSPASQLVRSRTREKWVAASNPLPTASQPEAYPAARKAFVSRRVKASANARIVRLKDVHGPGIGLRLVKWRDNRPLPILDHSGRVIALGAAQSSEPSFLEALLHATVLLQEARVRGTFSKKDQGRGDFPTLKWGFSHGGGRGRPMNVNLPKSRNFELTEEVMADPAFERLSRQISGKPPLAQHLRLLQPYARHFCRLGPEASRALCRGQTSHMRLGPRAQALVRLRLYSLLLQPGAPNRLYRAPGCRKPGIRLVLCHAAGQL